MSNQGGLVQAVKSYRFWILPSIDDCVDGAFNTKKNFDSTLEKVKTTYETTVENVKSTYENTIDTVKSTNESVQERVKANYDQGIFEGTKQTGMDLAHHGYNLSLFIMSLRIWQTKTVQDWFKTFFIFMEVNTNKVEDLYTTGYKKTPNWVQSKLDYLKVNVYLHKVAEKFQDEIEKIDAKFSVKSSDMEIHALSEGPSHNEEKDSIMNNI